MRRAHFPQNANSSTGAVSGEQSYSNSSNEYVLKSFVAIPTGHLMPNVESIELLTYD